jgi:predicted RNA-binding protein associated with RNAse of E/G family
MTQTPITIIKRDPNGQHVLSYTGNVLQRDETSICIEAWFTLNPVDVALFTIERGDRMVEWFYTDRYYNVFRVHDGDSDTVKGWYCNITRPAEISQDSVASDDLALDVVIIPDGTYRILDDDEYQGLTLSRTEQDGVYAAITLIRALVSANLPPFDVIKG